MIHCQTPDSVFERSNILLWILSAFKAGFINTTGFLLSGEFVSHVTGFGTRVGIATGHEKYLFGFELLLIPGFFILGGFTSSLILESNQKREYPRYWVVQFVITALIGLIVLAGEQNWISFKSQFGLDEDYTMIEYAVTVGLCFICGMKNALVSWTTYGKIKVTHLTGLSTDIGINLIRTFRIKEKGLRMNEPRFVNYIRMGILFAFSTGAFVAALMFPEVGIRSLYIILALSFCMTMISIADALHYKELHKLRSSQT